MATAAPSMSQAGPRRSGVRVTLDGTIAAAVILALAALLLRGVAFGNPAVDVDEQFYLLAGDRMIHGALPYIDFWDRKPIGNFLIYAAIRLLGGAGFLQYQLAATACAALTALLLRQIARRLTDAAGALAVGAGYLVYLGIFGGIGGQSPVFYNLPIAAAAYLVVRELDGPAAGPLRRTGCAAMALLGIAFQVKTTLVFEGAFLFAFLIHQGLRRRRPVAALAVDALAYVAAAGLPTALVFAFYAWHGATGALVFATVTSIFLRGPLPRAMEMQNLGEVMLGLIPLLPPAALATLRWAGDRATPAPELRRFVAGWFVAGTLAFVAIGNYYWHYALQMIAPLLLLGAPVIRRGSGWLIYLVGLMILRVVLFGGGTARDLAERAAQANGLAAAARPYAGHCMHIFEGPTSVYLLTRACTVTPYLFPEHLVVSRETRAIGVDQRAEALRVLAARPGTIVTAPRTFQPQTPAVTRLIRATLARDYREVYAAPPLDWAGTTLRPHLFVRRDLLARPRG